VHASHGRALSREVTLHSLARLWYVEVVNKRPQTWSELRKTYWGEDCWRTLVPLGRRWQAEIEFVVRHGRPVVASLAIYVPLPAAGYQLALAEKAMEEAIDEAAGPMEWDDLQPKGKDEAAAKERVQAEMGARVPSQGLTSSDLRGLTLKSITQELEKAWERLAQLDPEWVRKRLGKEVTDRTVRATRQQGKALTDADLADYALAYLDASGRRPRDPLVAMLEEYEAQGVAGLTRDILRDRVRICRDRGWLTRPGKRGSPGGRPGPKLRAWLRKQEGRKQ